MVFLKHLLGILMMGFLPIVFSGDSKQYSYSNANKDSWANESPAKGLLIPKSINSEFRSPTGNDVRRKSSYNGSEDQNIRGSNQLKPQEENRISDILTLSIPMSDFQSLQNNGAIATHQISISDLNKLKEHIEKSGFRISDYNQLIPPELQQSLGVNQAAFLSNRQIQIPSIERNVHSFGNSRNKQISISNADDHRSGTAAENTPGEFQPFSKEVKNLFEGISSVPNYSDSAQNIATGTSDNKNGRSDETYSKGYDSLDNEYKPFPEKNQQSQIYDNEQFQNTATGQNEHQTSFGNPNNPASLTPLSGEYPYSHGEKQQQVFHDKQFKNLEGDQNVHQTNIPIDLKTGPFSGEHQHQINIPTQSISNVHNQFQQNPAEETAHLPNNAGTPNVIENNLFSVGYEKPLFPDQTLQNQLSNNNRQFQNAAENSYQTNISPGSNSEGYNSLPENFQQPTRANQQNIFESSKTNGFIAHQSNFNDRDNFEKHNLLSNGFQNLNTNQLPTSSDHQQFQNAIEQPQHQSDVIGKNSFEGYQQSFGLKQPSKRQNTEHQNSAVAQEYHQNNEGGFLPSLADESNFQRNLIPKGENSDLFHENIASTPHENYGNYKGENGNGKTGSIPGIAGVDYPNYFSIPRTSFSCKEQDYPGYFADVETHCQVYHICQADGRHDVFLCPMGTIFHQRFFTCDWWYKTDCASSASFYPQNADLYRETSVQGNFKGYNAPQPNIQGPATRYNVADGGFRGTVIYDDFRNEENAGRENHYGDSSLNIGDQNLALDGNYWRDNKVYADWERNDQNRRYDHAEETGINSDEKRVTPTGFEGTAVAQSVNGHSDAQKNGYRSQGGFHAPLQEDTKANMNERLKSEQFIPTYDGEVRQDREKYAPSGYELENRINENYVKENENSQSDDIFYGSRSSTENVLQFTDRRQDNEKYAPSGYELERRMEEDAVKENEYSHTDDRIYGSRSPTENVLRFSDRRQDNETYAPSGYELERRMDEDAVKENEYSHTDDRIYGSRSPTENALPFSDRRQDKVKYAPSGYELESRMDEDVVKENENSKFDGRIYGSRSPTENALQFFDRRQDNETYVASGYELESRMDEDAVKENENSHIDDRIYGSRSPKENALQFSDRTHDTEKYAPSGYALESRMDEDAVEEKESSHTGEGSYDSRSPTDNVLQKNSTKTEESIYDVEENKKRYNWDESEAGERIKEEETIQKENIFTDKKFHEAKLPKGDGEFVESFVRPEEKLKLDGGIHTSSVQNAKKVENGEFAGKNKIYRENENFGSESHSKTELHKNDKEVGENIFKNEDSIKKNQHTLDVGLKWENEEDYSKEKTDGITVESPLIKTGGISRNDESSFLSRKSTLRTNDFHDKNNDEMMESRAESRLSESKVKPSQNKYTVLENFGKNNDEMMESRVESRLSESKVKLSQKRYTVTENVGRKNDGMMESRAESRLSESKVKPSLKRYTVTENFGNKTRLIRKRLHRNPARKLKSRLSTDRYVMKKTLHK